MCFGNQQQTGSTTSTPPAWLTSAAASNLGFGQQMLQNGFTPYGGNQVAGFSPQQQASFGLGNNLAASVNGGQIGTMVGNYANGGPQSIDPSTIASRMSPYMNQYVAQALAPQVQAQDLQFSQQNKGWDANAAGAGAFGDTGWALGKNALTNTQDAARTGLYGQAYTSAFNTAIGAGAQDVSNDINAQMANANFKETALQRQLQGANTLYGMGSGVTNLQNQLGGQQTAQSQAQLNAAYNQWQLAQQYPKDWYSLVNQGIGAAGNAIPRTTTTSAPNNSGYGMIGSLLGGIGGSMFGPGGTAIGSGFGSWLGGQFGGGNNLTSNSEVYPEAKGGPTPPVGSKVLVGERGPELYMPHDGGAPEAIGTSGPEMRTAGKPGTVIPHHALEAMRKKYAKKPAKTKNGIARAAMGGMLGMPSGAPTGGMMQPGMGAPSGAPMGAPGMPAPGMPMGAPGMMAPSASGGFGISTGSPMSPAGAPMMPGQPSSMGAPTGSGMPSAPGMPMPGGGMPSGTGSIPGAAGVPSSPGMMPGSGTGMGPTAGNASAAMAGGMRPAGAPGMGLPSGAPGAPGMGAPMSPGTPMPASPAMSPAASPAAMPARAPLPPAGIFGAPGAPGAPGARGAPGMMGRAPMPPRGMRGMPTGPGRQFGIAA